MCKKLETKRITTYIKWKIVEDYPEYKISNNGLLLKNGVLQFSKVETLGRNTYQYVNLRNKIKDSRSRFGKKFFIHRLVWIHFGSNQEYKPLVIDHINNNSMDNNIENLQLLTISQNLEKGKRYWSSIE